MAQKKAKIIKREEPRIVWYISCPYCDHEFRGNNESQGLWNLNLHIQQKHKDKQKVKEVKK